LLDWKLGLGWTGGEREEAKDDNNKVVEQIDRWIDGWMDG